MVNFSLDGDESVPRSPPRRIQDASNTMVKTKRRKVSKNNSLAQEQRRVKKMVNGEVKYLRVRRVVRAR